MAAPDSLEAFVTCNKTARHISQYCTVNFCFMTSCRSSKSSSLVSKFFKPFLLRIFVLRHYVCSVGLFVSAYLCDVLWNGMYYLPLRKQLALVHLQLPDLSSKT